jgi:alanyl-tRNA synthetase
VGLFIALSPEHVASGVSAKAICDHCISVITGGKGGGKVDMANATFPFSSVTPSALLDIVRLYISR